MEYLVCFGERTSEMEHPNPVVLPRIRASE